ncbi:S8 family peptidase [Aliikangiella sp. IMCC44359]|uniref:S8 family peptidase n=1 Tax=Aliikangiella sp. IMCC44359 TaxID=3459125 RepID=UPI00403AA318
MNNIFSRKSLFVIITGSIFYLHSNYCFTVTNINKPKPHANTLCLDLLNQCLPKQSITQNRKHTYKHIIKQSNSKPITYHEFPLVINLNQLKKISQQYKLKPQQQRTLLQQAFSQLNEQSSQKYVQDNNIKSNTIKKIAINNSIFIYSSNDHQIEENKAPSTEASSSEKPQINIALIDSGISTQHELLSSTKPIQYNPKDNNFSLTDSGLGHGTGIFSLLAASPKKSSKLKGLLPNAHYLSCNGLPLGQYNFIYILDCMNWIFLQTQVDILINAWLASSPGCKREWEYPLKALWLANTIPVFAAGNYGLEKTADYSPINLSPLANNVPIISVGAHNSEKKPLRSSSFGKTICSPKTNIVNIMAPGKDLLVATPFSYNSYQVAEGTSYAVAYVGAALANLKLTFPKLKNELLVKSLLNNTDKIPLKYSAGYNTVGSLNLTKAINDLKTTYHAQNSTPLLK